MNAFRCADQQKLLLMNRDTHKDSERGRPDKLLESRAYNDPWLRSLLQRKKKEEEVRMV
jgi:hypothetical protein